MLGGFAHLPVGKWRTRFAGRCRSRVCRHGVPRTVFGRAVHISAKAIPANRPSSGPRLALRLRRSRSTGCAAWDCPMGPGASRSRAHRLDQGRSSPDERRRTASIRRDWEAVRATLARGRRRGGDRIDWSNPATGSLRNGFDSARPLAKVGATCRSLRHHDQRRPRRRALPRRGLPQRRGAGRSPSVVADDQVLL